MSAALFIVGGWVVMMSTLFVLHRDVDGGPAICLDVLWIGLAVLLFGTR